MNFLAATNFLVDCGYVSKCDVIIFFGGHRGLVVASLCLCLLCDCGLDRVYHERVWRHNIDLKRFF